MKIKYLNGNRLYYAFLAGGNAVIADTNYLNKINVFPVPDSDTGTNMASTMRSIASTTVLNKSLTQTLRSIADAALSGARGNSGLIFAQFLHGISREVSDESKLSTKTFGESMKNAVQHAYKSMVAPVEGTMLTVMKDWAESVYRQRTKTADFVELLAHSLQAARKSLRDTPKKLSVLAKAGVVDAGAKGFVDFLEGIFHFIKRGKLRGISKSTPRTVEEPVMIHSVKKLLEQRYCTEALITGENIDLDRLRNVVKEYGSSAIVAGSDEKARIHIHTDYPEDLFSRVEEFGAITQIKSDDMKRQYEASFKRKHKIALVTDSACDIPEEIIEKDQIHVVPFTIIFGKSHFLDKVTLSPMRFYTLLRTRKEHPTSSQPPVATFQSLFSFLSSHYDSIIALLISDKLSGTFKCGQQAAKVVDGKKLDIIDSRNLSVTQGLILMRMIEAVCSGKSHEEIIHLVQEWIDKTRLLVDIRTLKYMVRGGRVSQIKGLLAKVLNLKPIITLDSEGKAVGFGKSFSRRSNMKKIIKSIKQMAEEREIWNYAIVHADNQKRAEMYAAELKKEIGKETAYIIDISPVVGVHNGIGVLGIGLMFK